MFKRSQYDSGHGTPYSHVVMYCVHVYICIICKLWNRFI